MASMQKVVCHWFCTRHVFYSSHRYCCVLYARQGDTFQTERPKRSRWRPIWWQSHETLRTSLYFEGPLKMASMSVKRPHIQTHVKDFVSFWAWFLEIFFLFFVFAPGRKVYPFCLLICETGFWGKIFQMLNSALTLGLNFVAIGQKSPGQVWNGQNGRQMEASNSNQNGRLPMCLWHGFLRLFLFLFFLVGLLMIDLNSDRGTAIGGVGCLGPQFQVAELHCWCKPKWPTSCAFWVVALSCLFLPLWSGIGLTKRTLTRSLCDQPKVLASRSKVQSPPTWKPAASAFFVGGGGSTHDTPPKFHVAGARMSKHKIKDPTPQW